MRLLFPALALILALSACSQDACNNLPVCLNPSNYARNHEIQPDPVSAAEPVIVAAGERQSVTVTFKRNGLPESLPIVFLSTFGNYPGEKFDFQEQQRQQARGTLLYGRGGVRLEAAANPFTGSSIQLTVSAAPGTPSGFYTFQVFLQKQNTRYGSARTLYVSAKVP